MGLQGTHEHKGRRMLESMLESASAVRELDDAEVFPQDTSDVESKVGVVVAKKDRGGTHLKQV